MKNYMSTVACMLLFSTANVLAVESVQLGAIEVNSVGDSISQSGISEGILNKGVASGPLAGKKVQDMPYQVNTISKEVLDNQGVQGFEEAVRYFPSAQIQYRGGGDLGRPQTRGFEGSVVGNVLWDGFYSVSTTGIPMAMFESLQVQNGLSGSLYGGQNPTGIFSYLRKRPVPLQNIVWADYSSRANGGVGLDTSNKFDKIGYRGVFYYSDGEKHAKDSKFSRRLASIGLDFYLTEDLTLETNFSYYNHKNSGMPAGFSLPVQNGVAKFGVPKAAKSSKAGLGQTFAGNNLKTTTASAKLKYALGENWYFEGGYQWQRAVREMFFGNNTLLNENGDFRVSQSGGSGAASKFEVQSYFVKALTEFETGFLNHNLAFGFNGYRWNLFAARNPGSASTFIGNSNLYNPKVFNNPNLTRGSNPYKNRYEDMNNVSIVDDIAINDQFSTILSFSNTWFDSVSIDKNTGAKNKSYDKSGQSYGISLVYKPLENISVYATYADALTAGSAFAYTAGPRKGEIVVLKPYRSEQYELGVKARINELDLSAAVFEISRPIAYVGDNGEYAEQGTQRNNGFEITTGGRVSENLSIYGGLTLLNPKLKNTQSKQADGKIVIGEPKVQSNLLFDYVVPNTDKLAFTANFHYTGKRYVDDSNQNSVDGYFTTDLGVRYVTKAWLGKETTLRFNVNNLFDEKYWAGMFPTNVDGTGGSRGTTLFLGNSRTFMLSGQVKF